MKIITIMKITRTKKPKNTRYIPLDDPYIKKKGSKETAIQVVLKEMRRRIVEHEFKENALLQRLTKK